DSHPLPRPFLVMATQNPIEQEGTYPLPEAQLDRFLFKAIVAFPPADDLVEILRRTTAGDEPEPQPVLDGNTLLRMARLVRQLPAGNHLLRYAATLVEATHPQSPIAPEMVKTYVRNGASPRGAQALVLGGKARALMEGRPNLATEDIWALAPMALRHRLVLGYDALADGVSSDDSVEAVVAAHPEPVESTHQPASAAAHRCSSIPASAPSSSGWRSASGEESRPLGQAATAPPASARASTSPTTAPTSRATTTAASTTTSAPAWGS